MALAVIQDIGIDMKELPDNFIAYFGTWGRPGHNLTPLNVNFYDEGGDWAAEFDSDAVMKFLSYESFSLFYYKGCTIIGYPRSVDDERGGSKSLFIAKGEHDDDYMVAKMKEYSDVYEIFSKLAEQYLGKKF